MVRTREDEFGGSPLPTLLCDESELESIEVRNGFDLAEYVTDLARQWNGHYQFTPGIVRECNRIAIHGIYAGAGNYRDRVVVAGDFVPAHHTRIAGLVDEMCDYVNSVTDVFHASAYLLWRTNWIHPFFDGNGRVSRELSYLAILVGLGVAELDGEYPIPVLIRQDPGRYLRGLRAADMAHHVEPPNVRQLESLLADLLMEQLDS